MSSQAPTDYLSQGEADLLALDQVIMASSAMSPEARQADFYAHNPDIVPFSHRDPAPAVPRDSPPRIITPELSPTERALSGLREALDGYASLATYCVAGTVPVENCAAPVVLRFESPGEKFIPQSSPQLDQAPASQVQNHKTTFPLDPLSPYSGLAELLEACTPATFGQSNKNVLDEEYRKAGKLDRSMFAIDFHPHDHGIVDVIAQTLLPGTDGLWDGQKGRARNAHRGVMCELYKLNVSSVLVRCWVQG